MPIVNCDSFSKITIQMRNDGIMLNNNILVEAKQEYLDSLFDLYGYHKKIKFSQLSIH
jgi:hypothetical protein